MKSKSFLDGCHLRRQCGVGRRRDAEQLVRAGPAADDAAFARVVVDARSPRQRREERAKLVPEEEVQGRADASGPVPRFDRGPRRRGLDHPALGPRHPADARPGRDAWARRVGAVRGRGAGPTAPTSRWQSSARGQRVLSAPSMSTLGTAGLNRRSVPRRGAFGGTAPTLATRESARSAGSARC